MSNINDARQQRVPFVKMPQTIHRIQDNFVAEAVRDTLHDISLAWPHLINRNRVDR